MLNGLAFPAFLLEKLIQHLEAFGVNTSIIHSAGCSYRIAIEKELFYKFMSIIN